MGNQDLTNDACQAVQMMREMAACTQVTTTLENEICLPIITTSEHKLVESALKHGKRDQIRILMRSLVTIMVKGDKQSRCIVFGDDHIHPENLVVAEYSVGGKARLEIFSKMPSELRNGSLCGAPMLLGVYNNSGKRHQHDERSIMGYRSMTVDLIQEDGFEAAGFTGTGAWNDVNLWIAIDHLTN